MRYVTLPKLPHGGNREKRWESRDVNLGKLP
jgi:hypothetical protein